MSAYLQKKIVLALPIPPSQMAQMDVNDDEAEREELRKQKEAEAKTAVMSSPYKEKKSANADKTLKTETNLFAKLSTTIGLCTENVSRTLT